MSFVPAKKNIQHLTRPNSITPYQSNLRSSETLTFGQKVHRDSFLTNTFRPDSILGNSKINLSISNKGHEKSYNNSRLKHSGNLQKNSESKKKQSNSNNQPQILYEQECCSFFAINKVFRHSK